jgi:hypothetical protein
MALWYNFCFLHRVSPRDPLSLGVRDVFLLIIEDIEKGKK